MEANRGGTAPPPVPAAETYAELFRLYRQFRMRHGRCVITAPVCHGPPCEFWLTASREWAVCSQHGTLHRCTVDTCTLKIIADDARVCPITATRYRLDVEDLVHWEHQLTEEDATHYTRANPWAQPHRQAQQMSAFTRFLRARAADPSFWKEKQTGALLQDASGVLQLLFASDQRRRLDADLVSSSDKHVQYNFRVYMEKRLRTGKPVFFTALLSMLLNERNTFMAHQALQETSPEHIRDHCRHYARVAVEYYAHVKGHPHIQSVALKKYQFRYHVLACCYLLTTGILAQTHWVLEPDPVIGCLLPPAEALHKLGFKNHTFTRHSRALRAAIVNLVATAPAPLPSLPSPSHTKKRKQPEGST